MMAMLSAGAAAIILYAGASAAASGHGLSIGTITAFVLLFQRFFNPIIALGDDWQTVQSALSGIERIRQVLAEPEEERAEAPAIIRLSGGTEPAIEVKDIVFGYFPDRPVLHGVSLTVAPGEHVAIVGRTGSGKSSLLSLVGGLYAPWSGSIRVNGRDPRGLPEHDRSTLMGVVPQLVQLFSGSVMDNLTLGDATVPAEAARRAAVVSGADTFIRALPDGYDTPIGGMGRGAGLQLSSGQRQLLALTRALVFDPPVLVLDEATSSMDGESDAMFRAALGPSISGGRGVVTVAHRLASACAADRVIVLEAGAIAEEGPPDDLIRRGGRFAAFLELEAAGWDWRTG
jgi:ATP-binding cassette subfamily B protein